MKHTAIICEYNPFHNGHLLQTEELRARGAETVTGILGGSFTQRGDAALTDSYSRAAAAVLSGGCDIVFELPYPYSASAADRFAEAGVSIAMRLGYPDSLAFGCEAENPDLLHAIADFLESPEAHRQIQAARDRRTGTPGHLTDAVRRALGEKYAAELTRPNNILAVAYLRAIRRLGAPLEPVFVHRTTVQHGDEQPCGSLASSSAIRTLLAEGKNPEAFLPTESLRVFRKNEKSGEAPADLRNAERLVLHVLRARDPESVEGCAEARGGLGRRILCAAAVTDSLNGLYRLAANRGQTNAHVRRALLSLLLDTPETAEFIPPAFTLLLAANGRGLSVFGSAEKSIPVISRPAEIPVALAQTESFLLWERAEGLRSLCCPRVLPYKAYRTKRPLILPR